MATLTIEQRHEVAERLFDEAWTAFGHASDMYAHANDAELAADFRRTWWGRYERAAARTRATFRRHAAQLDAIARDQAVLDANTTAPTTTKPEED